MAIIAGFMVPHPPMIVPDVGNGSERRVEATTKAYEKVADMIARLKPDTIVISSPHTVMYADYFHVSPGKEAFGSFESFGAPNVSFDISYDSEYVMSLAKKAAMDDLDVGILGERDKNLDHGTMVPLYFITKKYTDFKLVRIGLSGFSMSTHYKVGMEIKKTAEELNRRVVYIASGDLSHKLKDYGPYGFDPQGPVYDERIMDVMGRGAFDELFDFDENLLEKACECGHRSFVMMAGALDRTALEVEKLTHEDVTGVGYGICTYRVKGEDTDRNLLDKWEDRELKRIMEDRAKEDAFVRLARKTVETFVVTGEKLSWSEVKDEISRYADGEIGELENRRAGAFVSIHKEGRLRGCIGTTSSTTDSIAQEIIQNAISASTRDPRFSPITMEELIKLEITVDILGDSERIESEDQLDVKKYGVIVTKGMKRGLLLPNLDGVDTVEEQLSIAKRKAGLAADEKGCMLERFEVVRHY